MLCAQLLLISCVIFLRLIAASFAGLPFGSHRQGMPPTVAAERRTVLGTMALNRLIENISTDHAAESDERHRTIGLVIDKHFLHNEVPTAGTLHRMPSYSSTFVQPGSTIRSSS